MTGAARSEVSNTVLRPAADWELASYLADATTAGQRVRIVGSNTRADYGRVGPTTAIVSTDVMRGMTAFDPAGRMISARGGTRLSEVEEELRGAGLMLAFEPVDLAPIYGLEAGWMTVGGMIAVNLAGSRRIVAGSAADSLASVKLVSGSGDLVAAGAEVDGGRTGFDFKRVTAGSLGTLGVIAEATLKVTALPARRATLILLGLNGEIAVEAMGDALAGCPGITGALHLDEALAQRLPYGDLARQGEAVTLLRLEAGSDAGLAAAAKRLYGLLAAYGETFELDDDATAMLWEGVRGMCFVAPGPAPVWRIAVRPSRAGDIVRGIRRYMTVDVAYDGGGGVLWLVAPASADAGASDIRRVTASIGGAATLVRAEDVVRAVVDCFEPLDQGVETIARKLKAAFDPAGILNPGRLHRDF
jgi:glycolate oxidase FAD binding subunit